MCDQDHFETDRHECEALHLVVTRRQFGVMLAAGMAMMLPKVANAVTVSNDGAHLYVTGESDDGRRLCYDEGRSTAYATVAYVARNGTRRWAARFAGRTRDLHTALAVATSPERSLVFVSGNVDTACHNSNVATIAYRW